MGEKGENRKPDEKRRDDKENGWFLDFNMSAAQCYAKKGKR